MTSTVSTGIPNGPYSGPVFSKSCPPGSIELMGSNTWEGVYFVFIKLAELGTALVQAPPSQAVVDTPDQVFAEVLAEVDDEATVGTAMPLRPHHNLDRDDLETLPRLQHTSTSAAAAPQFRNQVDSNHNANSTAPRLAHVPPESSNRGQVEPIMELSSMPLPQQRQQREHNHDSESDFASRSTRSVHNRDGAASAPPPQQRSQSEHASTTRRRATTRRLARAMAIVRYSIFGRR